MEIGQLIQWQVCGKTMKGLFLQYIGDKAEVMCFEMGGVRCGIKSVVSGHLLTKLEEN